VDVKNCFVDLGERWTVGDRKEWEWERGECGERECGEREEVVWGEVEGAEGVEFVVFGVRETAVLDEDLGFGLGGDGAEGLVKGASTERGGGECDGGVGGCFD
jgi:hypothetical protein